VQLCCALTVGQSNAKLQQTPLGVTFDRLTQTQTRHSHLLQDGFIWLCADADLWQAECAYHLHSLLRSHLLVCSACWRHSITVRWLACAYIHLQQKKLEAIESLATSGVQRARAPSLLPSSLFAHEGLHHPSAAHSFSWPREAACGSDLMGVGQETHATAITSA
jgi:hypothetical protein